MTKTFFTLMFIALLACLSVTSLHAQLNCPGDQGCPGRPIWIPQNCPGDCGCPGNIEEKCDTWREAYGNKTGTPQPQRPQPRPKVSYVQKMGLEILTAQAFYTKRPALLSESESRTLVARSEPIILILDKDGNPIPQPAFTGFKRTCSLLAEDHGASAPPDPYDGGGSPCGCEWWNWPCIVYCANK